MKNNGCEIVDEHIIVSNNRFQKAGYEAMNSLFELDNQPDAVISAYDEMAIGVMKSIFEHGKKIPDDIAVIGMDDIRANPYLDVSLSSITSYNEDFCQIVTDILFEKITNTVKSKRRKINVSSELIKREQFVE